MNCALDEVDQVNPIGLLTTVQTLRLQRRNVLQFMTAVCEASLNGTRPPSLLPSGHPALALAA